MSQTTTGTERQEERLQVADNNWHREAGGEVTGRRQQLAQRGRRRGYRSQTTTGTERQEERLQVADNNRHREAGGEVTGR